MEPNQILTMEDHKKLDAEEAKVYENIKRDEMELDLLSEEDAIILIRKIEEREYD